MNDYQKFLLDIYREFGDNAQKALDFVHKNMVENNSIPMQEESTEAIAVDLGLPSGTLWADRNIGAKSPEDVGLYFSWGNTDGHIFGTDYNFNEEIYAKTEGAKLDGDIDLEHDAAHVNMGGSWRMPTEDDFIELDEYCTHELCSLNGYRGIKFTSKKNGNSLFFACSGNGNGSSWDNRGSYGGCWSASFFSARYARYLYFGSGGVYPQDNDNRCYGFAVRAVQ